MPETAKNLEIKLRENLYGFEYRDIDHRRVEPEERKTYNIKQLWQRNHEIINLAVRGFKNTEIASILNITPETVSMTLNSDLGKHKLSELRQARDEEAKVVAEKIRVLTDKALATYHEIFDSDHATMKDKKAVADTVLLELSGLRAPTRIQTHSVHTTLTAEEIAEFKARGMAAARESGVIVDVMPVDDKKLDE